MRKFVCRRNIERYRELLEQTSDEVSRRVLLNLLAEEENKLARLAEDATDEPAPQPRSRH
jgi:hypothetical protein